MKKDNKNGISFCILLAMSLSRLAILSAALGLLPVSAQSLSVAPAEACLGRFPAWEARRLVFTVRNTGAGAARLLRARSSCGCLSAEFRPCSLAPGQETTLAVTVPANSVSGEFRKTLFLETDAPGQEFLKLTVSGTAVPAVEVEPKREVYLGRLEAGKTRNFSFRLVPASPGMSLRLLPADDADGRADATLLRNGDSTFTLELVFTPDASRRYVAIRRRIAIEEWRHDIPPLTLAILFSTERSAGQ
jgi:hypothetical protein